MYFYSPFLLIFVIFQAAAATTGGHELKTTRVIPVSLEPLTETPTFRYYLSSRALDALTAQQICLNHGGNLVSVSSPSELETLQTSLLSKTKEASMFWTSGIRYSNSSVENLMLWSDSQQPFSFPLANRDVKPIKHTGGPLRKRRRRASNDDPDCSCSCTERPPTVRPRPLCKRPNCSIGHPVCKETAPRQCLVSRPPHCTAQERNCSVDCGTPKDCVIIKQPVCRVKPSDRPNCRLDTSNLGRCIVSKPRNCQVTAGKCHAQKVSCSQENVPCVPKVKPCKNPCSKQECVTVRPPCQTTQPPCVETTTPCPTPPPPEECLLRCKRSYFHYQETRHNCETQCRNASSTIPPPDCGVIVTCPPPVTVCPEPVTSCSKPFVDCSPLICQSNVYICPPPKVHCSAPQVVCESPVIKCDDPEVNCTGEPEVICDDPEVECDKPILKCPDPVVHCSPTLTTCDSGSYVCTDPAVECTEVDVQCGEPTECEVGEGEGGGDESSGCPCAGKCGNRKRSKRGLMYLPDMEITECIAVTAGRVKLDWVAQSCNLQHKFICKTPS